MTRRYGRFVDMRVIKERMDRKDARVQREAANTQQVCPRCARPLVAATPIEADQCRNSDLTCDVHGVQFTVSERTDL